MGDGLHKTKHLLRNWIILHNLAIVYIKMLPNMRETIQSHMSIYEKLCNKRDFVVVFISNICACSCHKYRFLFFAGWKTALKKQNIKYLIKDSPPVNVRTVTS